MIKGITIQLVKRTLTGYNAFHEPEYTDTKISVDNVLVGEPSTDDITNALQLYGKKVAYTLAIPKGDTNDWADTFVVLPEPFAGTYKTIGYPTAGIEANIPLKWNKKVKIERYDSEIQDEHQGSE